MTPLVARESTGQGGMIDGNGPRGAGNTAEGLTAPIRADRTGGLMPIVSNPTPRRTTIRKIAGRWLAACPCGFTWHTRWHRLALLMAVNHRHRGSC